MLEYLLSFLILTGAVFTFIGSLGLARLKDFYTRLHGPTKATTLGWAVCSSPRPCCSARAVKGSACTRSW